MSETNSLEISLADIPQALQRVSHEDFMPRSAGDYMVGARGPHKGRLLHTVIVEAVLGRPLPRTAVIHHIDDNGLNNANGNLIVCEDQSFHATLHARREVVRAGGNPEIQSVCRSCGQVKPHQLFHKRRNRPSGHQSKCKACYRRLFQEKRIA